MSVCCVKICFNTSRSNKNVRFHRFPMYKRNDTLPRKQLTLRRRMAWIRALKDKSSMTIENIENKRVCSAHFQSGEKAELEDITNPDWIPSLRLKLKNQNKMLFQQKALTKRQNDLEIFIENEIEEKKQLKTSLKKNVYEKQRKLKEMETTLNEREKILIEREERVKEREMAVALINESGRDLVNEKVENVLASIPVAEAGCQYTILEIDESVDGESVV